jgi:hypothetical protein
VDCGVRHQLQLWLGWIQCHPATWKHTAREWHDRLAARGSYGR